MKVTFFGAAGEVTGSAYMIETDRARILLDFGLHQGEAEAAEHNRMPDQIEPDRLDAVVLTHAHIDHSGRLPMLIPGGFRAPVFATPATIELTDILLRDAASLQQADADRANRYNPDGPPVKPLYGVQEVASLTRLFRGVRYMEAREVAPGISIRFFDAGHILGSASVEMTIQERGQRRVVAFSGDIGPSGLPLLRDAVPVPRAEIVFLESTYGDRDHRPRAQTIEEFETILAAARRTSGKVLIPAFAVGRTQDLIYEMGKLHRAGRFDHASVYIDSPMATDVTQVYRNHCEVWDAEAKAIQGAGYTPLGFPGLRFTQSIEDSKRLNDVGNGTVVIAGSGMCTGGRIVHHLKNSLWKPETRVVIVGFQGQGTLGRRLVDGQKHIRMFGEEITVKASIHTLGGFSAHAGQTGLAAWARAVSPRPQRLILTHGEPKARDALRDKLKVELGLEGERPLMFDTYEF